jgi:hypothetical protein
MDQNPAVKIPPPAFTYMLVWGGPGEFEWNDKGVGKAAYYEADGWVVRALSYHGTSDYYHFIEEKVADKKRRVWAFALKAAKLPDVPMRPLYTVGFYDEDDMEGTWVSKLWAMRL